MREQITEGKFGSTESFDQLEGHARVEIQRWMQTLLEKEVPIAPWSGNRIIRLRATMPPATYRANLEDRSSLMKLSP